MRDTRDVLDQLLGPGAPRAGRRSRLPSPIEPRLRCLLDAIERGHGSLAELVTEAAESQQVLQDLTDLELRGLVRREFGGRYVRPRTARSRRRHGARTPCAAVDVAEPAAHPGLP